MMRMKKIYPKRYNKEEFLDYLKKNKVSKKITNDFDSLPESITRSGDTFKLDITLTWYPEAETRYEFEINYYSEDTIEYLFNSKVFGNIQFCINYLMCELINGNYLKNGECDGKNLSDI
jgi:hypothetical protein